jgi:anti-anti-sigma factor
MPAVREQISRDVSVLRIEGPLRSPVHAELRQKVQALLERAERNILIDLTGVSDIDAAGLGELVEAYNLTNAVNGVLRITHPTTRVRELLARVGLLSLLSADAQV